MFKVERKIPTPEPAGRNPKYPWREMKVGDSFFVPGALVRTIHPAAHAASKRTGFKFTCRTISEAQGSGVRVWRIE